MGGMGEHSGVRGGQLRDLNAYVSCDLVLEWGEGNKEEGESTMTHFHPNNFKHPIYMFYMFPLLQKS